MLKRFFKDSLVYSFNNIIQKGISLFLVPVYTRIFSPTDYGIIDIITVLTTLVNLTIALEIGHGVARYYPEAKNKTDKIAYASTALWFTAAIYTIFFTLGLLFSDHLSAWVLGKEGQISLFRIALLSIYLSGIFNLVQNQLRWQLRSKQYSIVAISSSLLTVLLKIIFVVFLSLDLFGVFYAIVIGQLFGCILAYYYTSDTYKLIFNVNKLKEMLNFSAPLVISSIGVFISLFIDRIAIKELLSLHEVGLYGVGYRLASVTTIVMAGCQAALTPLIYYHYKEAETPGRISRIYLFFVAVILIVFMGISIFSREALLILAAPEYYGAYKVVPALILSNIFFGMYIFAPGLSIAKKTSMITLTNVLSAALNIALNLLLIPIIGIMGAATATAISAFVRHSLLTYLSKKYYDINYGWSKVLASIILSIILVTLMIDLSFGFINLVMKTLVFSVGSFSVISLLIGKDNIISMAILIKNNLRQSG